MCYTGKFKSVSIAFDKSNIFNEKGVILIKNAKSSETKKEKKEKNPEEKGKIIPTTIPLHEINMKLEHREAIRNLFLVKKTKEKTKGKMRKQRA